MENIFLDRGGCVEAWLSNLHILSLSLSTKLLLSLSKFLSIQGFFRRFDSVADLFYCFSETLFLLLFFSENVPRFSRWGICLSFTCETETQQQQWIKDVCFYFIFCLVNLELCGLVDFLSETVDLNFFLKFWEYLEFMWFLFLFVFLFFFF